MSTHICSSFNNVNATKNQKILVFVLALVTSIVASVGVIDAQEPFPEFNPTSKKIKKFGKAFDIIKLSSDGQKLKPDFEENRQAAQELFSKVRNSLNSSSSSSSSGGSSWASSMTSAGFTAACGLGHSSQFQIGKTNRFWVFVEESDSDKTTVQIEVDKKGLISVNFSSDGGAIFRFRQKSNGQVYCQDLASESAFVSGASNYDRFCREHPKFVSQRLEPIFKYIGLGIPPSRYSDEVAKNIIVDMQPVEDARMKEFNSAIEGLNAKSFDDREAAMKPLEKNFEEWRDLIQSAINDDELSVETRVRLKKIFKNSATEQEVGDLDIAQKGKLDEDASYLIWLLGKTESAELEISKEVKGVLVKKIEKLTGQNHGADLEQWQQWVGKNQKSDAKAPEPTITTKEILGYEKTLEHVSEHIGKLVRFKLDDEGLLKINREHWGKPFGGKSIKELTAQVQKTVEDSKLPESWFKPGGEYAKKSVDHPQVLFELMEQEFSDASNSPMDAYRYHYSNRSNASLNRKFVATNFQAEMRFHNDSGNGRRIISSTSRTPKKDFFDLTINETRKKPNRKLHIRESKDGAMILNLEYPNDDAMIRVVQSADKKSENRFVLFDVRGEVVKVYRAKSYKEFKSKEEEYHNSVFSPLLDKLNIKIDEDDSKATDEKLEKTQNSDDNPFR